MNKTFPKINILTFIVMLQLTTKLMNMLSYFIITHFILGNKDYHFCRNPHLIYLMCQLMELQGS